MKRGRTQRGRERATRGLMEVPSGRPLIEAVDHGPSVRVEAADVGATGDRWVEPFLEANAAHLRRLGVATAIDVRKGVGVRLTPGSRIGAVPLLSPSTRRVAAGLLVAPRFRWAALGAVLSDIGFATEPSLGGTPLVPGSAREVPAWLLAAPVLRRLEALLRHPKRGFTERVEVRQSPRGRVDWSRWARNHVPSGQWTSLPCHFTEPDDDPDLMAAVRWTLGRLDDELATFHEALPARLLRERVAELSILAGHGDARRPHGELRVNGSAWVTEATQAMGWVADERGLGGARVLDGMSWDLPIDEVWEAWVDAFVTDLAPRCGFTALRRGHTTRRLNWATPTASMRMLIPDSGMRGPGRLVWVDAKYKAHLQLIARNGWSGLEESTRDAHRADLHQALAYAALDDVEHVDSVLVYPEMTPDARARPAVATVASGKRRVRLLLMGLPFGFQTPDHRDQTLSQWRELLSP
ncbi:MAG: hypothetical protein KC593_16220 [Myxococcales bacterium]|nr:hypothetical protein [Myxococcales bacterium]MCB9628383.1 hypothetical protein [Sandaracinaceae bacterium]